MKRTFIEKLYLLMLVVIVILPIRGFAWSEHPLLVSKALKDLPVWKNMDSIQAKSLKTFLIETQKELVTFLAEEEKWAQANLPNYAKCPENLAFKATGNQDDILNRFFQAVRINPGAKIPLYLYLLPDVSTGNKPLAKSSELTTLKDTSSMPYHMKPFPGVSTLRMIWINLKSMLGMPKAKNNAVQLVSNRHTVLEEFQVEAVKKAYLENNSSYPLFLALSNPSPAVPFSYDFLINVASKESADNAKSVDKALKKNVPSLLVSDPSVETNDRPEIKNILQYMIQNKGNEAVDNMTNILAIQMKQFSRNVRSFMEAVLTDEQK